MDYLTKNNLEIEFGKIHFFKREMAIDELNKMDNPKRDYLAELLRLEGMSKTELFYILWMGEQLT